MDGLQPKNKPFCGLQKICQVISSPLNPCPYNPVALEDELGDVLDKAIVLSGLTPDVVASRAQVEPSRLLDALDWRSDFTEDELARIAGVLGLNEVGLCAVASGRYPLPVIEGLPFCLQPLRMAHGIGVVNAYLVAECGGDRAILFDTGPNWSALSECWPREIRRLDAVFLTHHEAEHSGGLSGLLAEMPVGAVFGPEGGGGLFRGQVVTEGAPWKGARFNVLPVSTPGHAVSHFGYRVSVPTARRGRELFISGDLLFAGTVGCAFFSPELLRKSLSLVMETLNAETVVAPGHGPMTTIGNERRYNPFIV